MWGLDTGIDNIQIETGSFWIGDSKKKQKEDKDNSTKD
jgi:hypothetical protein